MVRLLLRIVSTLMMIAAIIFVTYALQHPEAGIVINGHAVNYKLLYFLYVCYLIIMIFLFVLSFRIKK